MLRAHLTLVEATGPGDCHLRFPEADIAVAWRTASAFAFDDTHLHEAVNERPNPRTVLLAEFDRPMPYVARLVNGFAQPAYRYHPVQRGVHDRVLKRLIST